jgi:type II secretory pathway component PulF
MQAGVAFGRMLISGGDQMAARSRWAWLYWWPVSRADQMLFAEALSQAFRGGIEVSRAVRVAADAVQSSRFRAALREMAADCRVGYSLAESLSRTKVSVGVELLAALAVGEERGDLADSLSAYARSCDPHAPLRLAAALGRHPEVTRFAAALARLLRDRRLTVYLIEDAGRLAAGDGSTFATTAKRVADAMRAGSSFAEALASEPRTFDPLFCSLVAAPDDREKLRAVLARLADSSGTDRSNVTDSFNW